MPNATVPTGPTQSRKPLAPTVLVCCLLIILGWATPTVAQMAAESGNDTKAVQDESVKAEAAFLGKQQSLKRALDQATKDYLAAKVSDVSAVTQRGELQPKRQAAVKFLKANEAMVSFCEHAEEQMRQTLGQYHLSHEQIDVMVDVFHQKTAAFNPLLAQVKRADGRVAQANLDALDLLDTNWGKWSYDQNRKQLAFSDTAAQKKYDACMREADKAANEEAALQKKFIAMMKSATAQNSNQQGH